MYFYLSLNLSNFLKYYKFIQITSQNELLITLSCEFHELKYITFLFSILLLLFVCVTFVIDLTALDKHQRPIRIRYTIFYGSSSCHKTNYGKVFWVSLLTSFFNIILKLELRRCRLKMLDNMFLKDQVLCRTFFCFVQRIAIPLKSI